MLFPYDSRQRPTLPVTLRCGDVSLRVEELADSGADVNVLPLEHRA